jgi:peptidyl-prolyl cis-trans isomerase SurA
MKLAIRQIFFAPNWAPKRQKMRRTASVLLAAAGVLGAVLVAQPATAQDVQRIAAVVNEEVISIFDVQQRMQLLIASAGLPNNPETQRRIAPQVLRELIDRTQR